MNSLCPPVEPLGRFYELRSDSAGMRILKSLFDAAVSTLLERSLSYAVDILCP